MSTVSKPCGSLREPRAHSLRRNLSKSMRGDMRSLSIHHLRNVQVEELAADLIHDIIEGDDVDQPVVSPTQQHFKYLESKSEIRCLTRPMSDKRRIKTLLENYENTLPSLKSNNFSLKSRAKWHHMLLKSKRSNHQGFLSSCFKSIEGRLGPGGSLFFRFISSVILLDILVFLLSLFFLSFPQIARRQLSRTGHRINGSFDGRELILGDGWLEGTELYYGQYTHSNIDFYSYKYNLSTAYFVVPCITLFCSLVILCVMFSRAFEKSYYNTRGGSNHVDANLVFSAWNFNMREEKMAVQCSRNVYLDLKILSLELKRKMRRLGVSDKVKAVMMMIAVEVLIIIMIVASPTVIYYACVKAGEFPRSLSFKLGIPVLLTSLNSFIPKFFSELGKAERFRSSRTSSYLIVVRTSFLQVCNVGVLVYYWFSRLACSAGECKPIECWETFVGTQLYTLIILNLLMAVTISLIQVMMRCLYKVTMSRVRPKFMTSLVEPREFDVGRSSVDVVYVQCLLWLSLYFSPLLSILVIIKLFIMLGLKKLLVMLGCYESVKVWRLGHLETLIRLLHLVTFLLCLSAFLYTIVYATPSGDCGPFATYQRPYEIFDSSPSTNSSTIGDSFGIIIKNVFSSVGFRVYVCLVFGIVVFYLRVHADGRHGVTEQVKRQIELESKDRCYYLETLKLLRNHLRNPGEQVEVRRRRPGINQLVQISQEQSKPLNTPPTKPTNPINPVTPCVGPSYWPPDKRNMMTSDHYNVMFPNKRSSSHAHLDLEASPGVYQAVDVDQTDINPLSEEVDRLFDFEADGDDDVGDDMAGNL